MQVLAPGADRQRPVIACAKGIEHGTHKFMTEVIAETAPAALPAILSGPSFAADVARGLPAAVTLACRDGDVAAALAHALGSAAFRPYHSTDVRGVEIGGAAKNVLAIAAGIVAGRGLGASAAAALVTRGFAELFRFGRGFGARPETLTGLSGLGDLILSCSSPQSRNYACGVALGEGRAPPHGTLAEGAFTAPVLVEMADTKGIDMPIAAAVADILAGRVSIDAAIETLLTRPFRRRDSAPTEEPMAYWLLKTEPEEFSWDDQVKRGAKGEPWTGVRNFTARRHMTEMKKGDHAFFYHTGDERQVVGIVEVIREAYPDPTDEKGVFKALDVKAMKPVPKPVTLRGDQGRAAAQGHGAGQVRRLSVQPVTAQEWKLVCTMGGVKG